MSVQQQLHHGNPTSVLAMGVSHSDNVCIPHIHRQWEGRLWTPPDLSRAVQRRKVGSGADLTSTW
jgi:hypothetical protein